MSFRKHNEQNIDMTELRKYLIIDVFADHIEKNFRDFINRNPDGEREKKEIEIIKRYKDMSTSGDIKARKVVKEQIKTNLLRRFAIYSMDDNGIVQDDTIYEDLRVTEDNGFIDYIIPFNSPAQLTSLEKFEILMYLHHTVESNGRDGAFRKLINKYPYHTKQRVENHYTSDNFALYEEDIDRMYQEYFSTPNDNRQLPILTFADKVEIVVQRLYEDAFGLKVIDTLAYSDINEVGFGNDGKYIYCWDDLKYWLKFMTLSEDDARIVQERAISWDSNVGPLNEAHPERLCHRADGARITVTQKPYFSARNLCIRIFNKSHSTFYELVPEDRLKIITIAGVKLGLKFLHQGSLGTGKSTLAQVEFEICDDFFHIGLAEDHFEQHLMDKYTGKRVIEGQAIKGRTLEDVVTTFKRMSVDIACLGEFRTGEALYAYLQLVQAVSIAAWTTGHIIRPEFTVPYCKNMLMGTGKYQNEQAAVMDVIHNINLIYQHEIIDGVRVVSQIVEIEPLVETSFMSSVDISLNMDKDLLEKIYYIQEIQKNPSNMYRLNKIMEYTEGEFKFVGYPSKRLILGAMKNKNNREYIMRLLNCIKADTGISYEELIKV